MWGIAGASLGAEAVSFQLVDALRRTHADEAALRTAWDEALDANEGLATGVRIDLSASGRRGEETLRFLVTVQGDA